MRKGAAGIDYPFVTICVPARNAEHTLRRTLDSILAQDYSNFEVIVSDNLSGDRTASVIQEYAKQGVRYCTPGKRLAQDCLW